MLEEIEKTFSKKRVIHVILDNARYHHVNILQPRLESPERRVKLHFLPPYAPHLNLIVRLWAVSCTCGLRIVDITPLTMASRLQF